MVIKSLDDVLNDFSVEPTQPAGDYTTITLWVHKDYKARYDELQKKTSRRFCKKLRELIMIAIDTTQAKAS
jgi:hypothetical protein